MDLKKFNDAELIQLCIDNGIEYFNSKTNKNYSKNTLISRINNQEKKEDKQEEKQFIEYKNEIIYKLTDEDKKNNDEYKDIENKLLSCIKTCHNILYSNGSIVGIKASNDIIKIIILRLINILYKNDDIKQEIKNIINNDEIINKYEKYLIDIKEFNKSINIDNDIKLYILKIIIGIVPDIFNNNDITFNTRNNPSNYKEIINKLCELINNDNYYLFIKLFSDTGGNIYEYFTNSYGKGNSSKELGQFFTPFKLINLMLFNIRDIINIDDNYTIYDPCCGSGGLLNRTANYLNINRSNIYGFEIEKDTIKYALSSLLVNNNNSLKIHIINKCSLTNNKYIFENKKFNLILTNPPFGTKMTYKGLKSNFEEYKFYEYKTSDINFEDVYPINTNNGSLLFLQHVIYMLEDNGICGIILPDGSELTNKTFYNIRKYLIDNCKILKVINVDGGAFNSTGIKTKILIFKKQKGNENHKNIEFLEINKECNEVKLIAIADLDKTKSFKLKINDDEDKIDKEINKDIEIKTLGEICDIQYGNRIVKTQIETGEYPVYGSGRAMFYTNKFNREGYNILIGRFALSMECVRIINEKIFLNDSGLSIKSKIPLLLDKYIGYYLLNNQKKIYNLASGTAQKNLNIEEFKLIKIPIPSIEKQNELIKQLDILDNSNKDAFKLIDNLKECNKIKLKNVKYNSNIEYKKLSDVCKFQNGKAIKKELLIDGEYPVIGGGKKPFGFHNEYNCFENTILCSSTGTAGFISKYNKKVWISDCFSIIPINYDYLNNNYLYHYLKSIQDKIYELQSGAVQPHVYSKDLSKLEIQIPSIDIQEEIINYCDNNLTIIENLNKSIDGNKKIMKNMINNI